MSDDFRDSHCGLFWNRADVKVRKFTVTSGAKSSLLKIELEVTDGYRLGGPDPQPSGGAAATEATAYAGRARPSTSAGPEGAPRPAAAAHRSEVGMSDDHIIRGTAAGFTCPVLIPDTPEDLGCNSGIAGCGVIDVNGEPRFALTIVHADGSMLTALLDERLIDDVANQMVDFVEALPRLQSVARH